MIAANISQIELLAEIEHLRACLKTAEETLQSIDSGEVDAFVIPDGDGGSVFTLQGAERPYRVLVESMNEGAASLISDGTIFYCNSCLAAMLQIPPESLTGTRLSSYLSPTDQHLFAVLFERSFENPERGEFTLINASNDAVPVIISCKSLDLPGAQAVGVVVTDTSMLKRAEKKLHESEKLYRSLFDNMKNGLAYCRLLFEGGKPHDFIYLSVNNTFEPLTGLKDVVGRKVSEVIPGIWESDPQLFEVLGRVALTGQPEQFEMFVEAMKMWFSISVYSPAAEHFVTVFDVITERKQAEMQLSQSRDLLLNLANLVPGVIYQYRLYPDGRSSFPYSSPGMNDIYEVTPEEVKEDATPVFGRLHPDDYENIVSSIQESAHTLRMFYGEFRVILPRQGLRWRWCQAQPQRMPDGGTLWHGIISDITERKNAGEEMNNLTQRLQLATKSASLGVWDWNVRDNQMVWDDRMFEMYGITRDQFSNSIDAWKNGLHPEDSESTLIECQAALDGEKEFDTTFRVCHPDGTVKYLKANALVTRGTDGAAERMIGINADVTKQTLAEAEKARLEAQLLQSQKMEAVGRLAGGVAHDFNNMLGVIIGHSELALMKLEPSQPIRGNIIEIRTAAERSAALTRQLLAFARKQTIAPKVINLNETVAGMLKMLQRLIGENVNLTLQTASNLWTVRVDPSQIDQLLANLCVNARDAITDVGRITIETGNSSFDRSYCAIHSYVEPGEYVRLAVSDNGIGMDKETATHIFEPFYTTKELGKGTGLGLATVYGIVKQNNGFINVYSEPALGTTFTIYLPRHTGVSDEVRKESAAAPVPGGSETILLVEDEPTNLKMAALLLEEQGYTVLPANSSREAIRLLREHTSEIHLLVTDVIMPDINGSDLAHNLLVINPKLKCLFMSGYTSDVIARHGVLDEGVNFIQKPFSLSDLANKVREVLDGE